MAIGQKALQVRTLRTLSIKPMAAAADCLGSSGGGHPKSSGRSLTNIQTNTASTRVKTPTTIKESRQPIQELSNARGVAANKEPTPPSAINIPVIKANSRRRNHSARTFMVGTKSIATPNPTNVRPKMAKKTEGAAPSKTEPIKATAKKSVIVFLGPQESERRPAGSCITA